MMKISNYENDYENDNSIENLEELAKEKNCQVIYSNPKYLLLDIDNENNLQLFFNRINKLNELVDDIKTWSSSNGNGHVQIFLKKELSFMERIFLQIFLGSNNIKEFLSWKKWLKKLDEKNCSVLFKPNE